MASRRGQILLAVFYSMHVLPHATCHCFNWGTLPCVLSSQILTKIIDICFFPQNEKKNSFFYAYFSPQCTRITPPESLSHRNTDVFGHSFTIKNHEQSHNSRVHTQISIHRERKTPLVYVRIWLLLHSKNTAASVTCIVPLCWITFCIHSGIIPVGQFSRKCAKSINQA